MRLPLCFATLLAPSAALAEALQRTMPEAQTAQAELSYLVAAILLLAALIGVQWLVNRR